MDTLSLKIPRALRKRLATEAQRRGVSQSTVVREALEAALLDRPRQGGELTCADLAGGLIGSFRGKRDSSTNQRYLDEAIVADAMRTRRRRSIGAKEARSRAGRLIDANRELFRRLADEERVASTVKRTVKDYRKTLRKLA